MQVTEYASRGGFSESVEVTAPFFKFPEGRREEDILIVWDFQNVRIPNELEPVEVLRFLYNSFIAKAGPRRCWGCYGAFTDLTKRMVGEKRFNQFTSNGVLNVMMLNAPGGPRKTDDTDHPLKEVMMNFTVDCIRGHKDGVILLITGDADFVRPAVWCRQQGCVRLELLYYEGTVSRDIRALDASWKMEWRQFLDAMTGGARQWTFPYPSNMNNGWNGHRPLTYARRDANDSSFTVGGLPMDLPPAAGHLAQSQLVYPVKNGTHLSPWGASLHLPGTGMVNTLGQQTQWLSPNTTTRKLVCTQGGSAFGYVQGIGLAPPMYIPTNLALSAAQVALSPNHSALWRQGASVPSGMNTGRVDTVHPGLVSGTAGNDKWKVRSNIPVAPCSGHGPRNGCHYHQGTMEGRAPQRPGQAKGNGKKRGNARRVHSAPGAHLQPTVAQGSSCSEAECARGLHNGSESGGRSDRDSFEDHLPVVLGPAPSCSVSPENSPSIGKLPLRETCHELVSALSTLRCNEWGCLENETPSGSVEGDPEYEEDGARVVYRSPLSTSIEKRDAPGSGASEDGQNPAAATSSEEDVLLSGPGSQWATDVSDEEWLCVTSPGEEVEEVILMRPKGYCLQAAAMGPLLVGGGRQL